MCNPYRDPYSKTNNSIGYVEIKKQRWDILNTDHADQRSYERSLKINDLNLIIALLIDQLEKSPKMWQDVLELSTKGHRVFFRDDVNDVAMVLKFTVAQHNIELVTCWSQLVDRQLCGRAHSNLKPGYNILAQPSNQPGNPGSVRLIYRYANGSCETISRDENWEISPVENIHVGVRG